MIAENLSGNLFGGGGSGNSVCEGGFATTIINDPSNPGFTLTARNPCTLSGTGTLDEFETLSLQTVSGLPIMGDFSASLTCGVTGSASISITFGTPGGSLVLNCPTFSTAGTTGTVSGEISFSPVSSANETMTVTGSSPSGGTATLVSLTAQVSLVFKCPLGKGFWKNNPSAWPVTSLTLGGKAYTQAELLMVLTAPVGSGSSADASLILADQLIAAKLSIANGSTPAPVASTIADPNSMLAGFSGKLPYNVAPPSTAGQQMTADASILDSYNNDLLAPNCTQ